MSGKWIFQKKIKQKCIICLHIRPFSFKFEPFLRNLPICCFQNISSPFTLLNLMQPLQTKQKIVRFIGWWTVDIFGVFILPFRLNHHLLVVVWLLHDIREIEEQKKEFEKKKRGNFIVLKRESWVFACAISILLSMELTFSILLHNPFCPHCIYRLQFLPSHCKCLCSKSVCVSIYKEYKFIVFILSYFLQEKLSVDLNAVHKNVFQMHFGFFCVLLSCLLPCVAWNVLTYKVNNIIL